MPNSERHQSRKCVTPFVCSRYTRHADRGKKEKRRTHTAARHIYSVVRRPVFQQPSAAQTTSDNLLFNPHYSRRGSFFDGSTFLLFRLLCSKENSDGTVLDRRVDGWTHSTFGLKIRREIVSNKERKVQWSSTYRGELLDGLSGILSVYNSSLARHSFQRSSPSSNKNWREIKEDSRVNSRERLGVKDPCPFWTKRRTDEITLV